MSDNEKFTYSYSAENQEEIEKIRKKYLPKEDDKMQQLRRLDEGVTQKAMIASLSVGIIGALILGFGMSCVMVWADKLFAVGIIIGIIGIAVIAAAYPIYNYISKKQRFKIAPQILELTDELMQKTDNR
ncbi:MAG: hypothetical protein ACI4IQ_07870 [Eubacterium sp.]